MDDAAVVVGAFAGDEAEAFQPVDEAGDAWDFGDKAVGDFETGEWRVFAAEDAEDVVLGGGQPVLAKEACEAELELVGSAPEVEQGFLLGGGERALLLELASECGQIVILGHVISLCID